MRLRYLVALGTVLVVLLGALALNELRAARRVIADAMEVGASLLVETIARAGENAIRSDARVMGVTADRLMGHARVLRELDSVRPLTQPDLAHLAQETGLHQIQLFDAAGQLQASSSSGVAVSTQIALTSSIDDLLGDAEEAVVDARHVGLQHGFAVCLRRRTGGAILVSTDAEDMLAFRRDAGIGRLVQDIGDRKDIAYLVLQDRQGVVLASRGVSAMTRIAGDLFLESALSGTGPRSRWVEAGPQDLFETVLPFRVDAENPGLIRLGLVADAVAVAEARSRRRLAIWAGLLAIVGVGLVALITIRQNYALLDDAHTRIQTTSSRVLANMADVVIVIDGDGSVSLWNRAAEVLFRVDAEAALGADAGQIMGALGVTLQEAIAADRESQGEGVRSRLPDGRLLDLSLSLSMIPGVPGSPPGAVALIHDLTEQRAMEANLHRAERLSAMGELAAGVAHEVRNPLNAIGVIAQRLQREFSPHADAAEYAQLVGTVRDEVGRVNDIVRQFLELARAPTVQPLDTDLERLLSETAHLAGHSGEARGVSIDVDVAGMGRAFVDGAQLRQAVLNLLVNAIDAVAADVVDDGGARGVRLVGRRSDLGVTIVVADDGPGIDPAQRERIFDLYYTTKAAGSGLGLALVQRIVTEHGGRVNVDTEIGHGSTFTIHLPLAPTASI